MTTQYILNKFSIFIYLILNVICATFEFIVWPGRFMISGLLKILNHMFFITKSLFQRDIFEITFFVNNIYCPVIIRINIYIFILELYFYSFTVKFF
jgi:hypothetical protein